MLSVSVLYKRNGIIHNLLCLVVSSSVRSLNRVRLCDPMDSSTPGLPVHHQLLTYSNSCPLVGDAIQPFYLLSSPSAPSSNLSQHQGLQMSQFFASDGQSIGSFSFTISPSNEYSGLVSFRMDWLDFLQSKRLSRVFSNTTVQKHQFFSARLSL